MKEIEEKAEKVLGELANALREAEVEYEGEVYYINELKNVFRKEVKTGEEQGKGKRKSKKPACSEEFVELMKKNAPKIDDQGYIIAEVGTWVK